jgi:hypothetical protein
MGFMADEAQALLAEYVLRTGRRPHLAGYAAERR